MSRVNQNIWGPSMSTLLFCIISIFIVISIFDIVPQATAMTAGQYSTAWSVLPQALDYTFLSLTLTSTDPDYFAIRFRFVHASSEYQPIQTQLLQCAVPTGMIGTLSLDPILGDVYFFNRQDFTGTFQVKCSIQMHYSTPYIVDLWTGPTNDRTIFATPGIRIVNNGGSPTTFPQGNGRTAMVSSAPGYEGSTDTVAVIFSNMDFITATAPFNGLSALGIQTVVPTGIGTNLLIEMYTFPGDKLIPTKTEAANPYTSHTTAADPALITPDILQPGDRLIKLVLKFAAPLPTSPFSITFSQFLGPIASDLFIVYTSPTSHRVDPTFKASARLLSISPCTDEETDCPVIGTRSSQKDIFLYSWELLSLYDQLTHIFVFPTHPLYFNRGPFNLQCLFPSNLAVVTVPLSQNTLEQTITVQRYSSLSNTTPIILNCYAIVSQSLANYGDEFNKAGFGYPLNPIVPFLVDSSTRIGSEIIDATDFNIPVPFNDFELPYVSGLRPIVYGLSSTQSQAVYTGNAMFPGRISSFIAFKFKIENKIQFDMSKMNNAQPYSGYGVELTSTTAPTTFLLVSGNLPQNLLNLTPVDPEFNEAITYYRSTLVIDPNWRLNIPFSFSSQNKADDAVILENNRDCTMTCASSNGCDTMDGIQMSFGAIYEPHGSLNLITSSNLEAFSEKNLKFKHFLFTPKLTFVQQRPAQSRYIARPVVQKFIFDVILPHEPQFLGDKLEDMANLPSNSIWKWYSDNDETLLYVPGTQFSYKIQLPTAITPVVGQTHRIRSVECFGRSVLSTNPKLHEAFDLNFLGIDEKELLYMAPFPSSGGSAKPEPAQCQIEIIITNANVLTTQIDSIQIIPSVTTDSTRSDTLTVLSAATTNMNTNSEFGSNYNFIGGNLKYRYSTTSTGGTTPSLINSSEIKPLTEFKRDTPNSILTWPKLIWDEKNAENQNNNDISIEISLQTHNGLYGSTTFQLMYYPVTSIDETNDTDITFQTTPIVLLPFPLVLTTTTSTLIDEILTGTLTIPSSILSSIPTTASSISGVMIPKVFIRATTTLTLSGDNPIVDPSLLKLDSNPFILLSAEISTSCSECYVPGTLRCDVTNPFDTRKCVCKSDFGGNLCESENLECSDNDQTPPSAPPTSPRCSSNGFLSLIDKDMSNPDLTTVCTDEKQTECICRGSWIGKSCSVCPLYCNNNGRPEKNCNKCGCPSGFTGNTCQCQGATGSIIINGYNQFVIETQGKLQTLISTYSLYNSTSLQYVDRLDEIINNNDSLGLYYLIELLGIELPTELFGNGLAQFTYTLSPFTKEDSTSPTPLYTKFNFNFIFGCDEYNPSVKSQEQLGQLWTTFVTKFTQIDVIKTNFIFPEVPEVDNNLEPAPETLPTEEEDPTEEEPTEQVPSTASGLFGTQIIAVLALFYLIL